MYKFIQLNSWFSGKLIDDQLRFFEREKPDIIALQEVAMPMGYAGYNANPTLDFLKKLKEITGCIHSIFIPECAYRSTTLFNNTEPVDFGIAICSKYPIMKFKYKTYIGKYEIYDWEDMNDWSKGHKGILVAKLDINGNKMYISTTHGIWGFDDGDNDERLHMAHVIASMLEDEKPLLFSGDLNVREDSETIRRIEKVATNVFKSKLKTSFNMRHKDPSKGTFASCVVDFVFSSPGLSIQNAYTTDDNVSDHIPLIVEFTL